MQKQQTSLLKFSLLASVLGLSACGGGSGGSSPATTEPPAKPLVSSFSSSLTVQDEGQPVQAIASRTTTEGKDSTLAYLVSTTLSNSRTISIGDSIVTASFPVVSKTFSFQLGDLKDSPILDILYDTAAQTVTDITLRRDRKSPLPDTSTCNMNNQTNAAFSCQGVTFGEMMRNGKFSITFNNTILRKTANDTPQVHTVALNGKLTGELSIPPRDFQDIPQTSSGNIFVNGKVLKVLATSQNSRTRGGYSRTGLTALLEDGSGIYFGKYANGNYESRYVLPAPAGLITGPETITRLNHQTIAQSDTFQLGATRFIFEAPMHGETPVPLTISGHLTVPKPLQQFSYAPVVPANVDANSYWYATNSPLRYSYIPEGISITLTNHNQVQLESNGFTAIIKDKKVQSINYESMLMNADPIQYAAYSCGRNSFSCHGATVTADGFGILFNNTKLGDTDQDAIELPAAITLNGGLVYPGR